MNSQDNKDKPGDMKTTIASDGSVNGKVFEPLHPRIQDVIGRSLKAHYDDLVNAPVPDKFLALLAELEAKERKSGN
jgi:Anti-sigma factor NepR